MGPLHFVSFRRSKVIRVWTQHRNDLWILWLDDKNSDKFSLNWKIYWKGSEDKLGVCEITDNYTKMFLADLIANRGHLKHRKYECFQQQYVIKKKLEETGARYWSGRIKQYFCMCIYSVGLYRAPLPPVSVVLGTVIQPWRSLQRI